VIAAPQQGITWNRIAASAERTKRGQDLGASFHCQQGIRAVIQLILVFCLSGGPQTCKEVQPVMTGIETAEDCLRSGQSIAITELNSRLDLQGYELTGWRCIAAQREERRI